MEKCKLAYLLTVVLFSCCHINVNFSLLNQYLRFRALGEVHDPCKYCIWRNV
jgi:hypothetical protein